MHCPCSSRAGVASFFGGIAFVLLVATISALVAEASADERLEGIACRSVHLAYDAPDGDAFYNEVRVVDSAPGTYFCTNGFGMGYFGIQELASSKMLVIFSVWDPGKQNDPNAVDEDRRVQVLHHDPDVRVKRFGNEGTGGQSFFDYDWKVGETYRFLVRSRIDGERTVFSGYFWLPEEKRWKHLVSFSTLAGKRPLHGYYSFVEDFRRNRESARRERRALYGNGWVRSTDGRWHALTRARFTADRNPVMNIDAGIDGDSFYLATGGDVANMGTPLWSSIDRPPSGVPAFPGDESADGADPAPPVGRAPVTEPSRGEEAEGSAEDASPSASEAKKDSE